MTEQQPTDEEKAIYKCKRAIQTLDETIEDLKDQLQPLVQRSKQWQQDIVGAKTATKRTYFKKKIRKNNHVVMHMLVTLESYQNLKDDYVSQLADLETEALSDGVE